VGFFAIAWQFITMTLIHRKGSLSYNMYIFTTKTCTYFGKEM